MNQGVNELCQLSMDLLHFTFKKVALYSLLFNSSVSLKSIGTLSRYLFKKFTN